MWTFIVYYAWKKYFRRAVWSGRPPKIRLLQHIQARALDTRDLENEPVIPEEVTYYVFIKDNLDQYVKLTKENQNNSISPSWMDK